MPKHVAKTRYLAVNGTAISDHCRNIEVVDEANDVDVTSYTAAAYREYAVGFKDANITAEIFADFDASSVHAILQPLYASGTIFAVEVREDQTLPVSATNPRASMNARLYAYSPVAGAVGDAAAFTCTFRNAGTAGLQWLTS